MTGSGTPFDAKARLRDADPLSAARRIRRSDEQVAQAYREHNIRVLNLANNHSMDFGPEGLERCLTVLQREELYTIGAGANRDQAYSPAIVELAGWRVAFLGFTSVLHPTWVAHEDQAGLAAIRVSTSFEPHPRHAEVPGTPPIVRTLASSADVTAAVESIGRAHASADFVVVHWHSGLSQATAKHGSGKALSYQTEVARVMIDAGADVVACHHPETIGRVEIYRGKPIFYSLGRFATELLGRPPSPSIFARCTFGESGLQEVSLVPLGVNDEAQPHPIERDHWQEIIDLTVGENASERSLVRADDVLVHLNSAAPPSRG